jgi:prepilin-type N-terminal cleavage/methylation domain-containing protein
MRHDRLAGRAVRSQARRRRRPRKPDGGFTLVEIVMTVTIMAIILIPTMDAVIATIHAGTNNTNFSDVETVLQNAADRVNRAPKSCDYTQYAQAAAQFNGWSASTTAVLQQHYVPGATSTANGSWAAAACVAPATTPTDLAVQLVTITVTSPDGHFQKTLQVVKSDV